MGPRLNLGYNRPVLHTLCLLLALSAGDDAGAPDGGTPDAGLATPAPAPKFSWVHGDGGWIADGGVTDLLTVRVGETARVVFPFPLVLMQCDDPLLELGASEDTLLLKGLQPGSTRCGYWYYQQAWPHRYMEVTVTR